MQSTPLKKEHDNTAKANTLPPCCLTTSHYIKFRLFFFLVQSQIALWSLTHMCHLCMRTAHGICRSFRHEKSARSPFAVDQHSRMLNVFGTGLLQALREINLRASIFSLFIKNQVILNRTKGSNNLGYQFFSLINGILRGVIVFLEVIVNQLSLFSCNRDMCLYNSETHIANYCAFKLKFKRN